MNGYDEFFKKAQMNRGLASPKKKTTVPALPNVSRQKPKVPFVSIIILVGLVGLMFYGPGSRENIERIWNAWELKAFSLAGASETAAPNAKATDKKSDDSKTEKNGKKEPGSTAEAAKDAETKTEGQAAAKSVTRSWTEEEISLFKNLEQRKEELDRREADLGKMEEELQKQRVELEARLKMLEETRRKIAGQLQEKVTSDQEKIDRLVSMYSSMKPQNAAKVVQDLNEDLAVEILSKMKQKNAAEILNLLPSEKAQKITEKFAGYKRAGL